MDWLTAWPWSPYAAGAGIGVLSWLTLLISGHPIGCSTSFARTAGMIEKLFRGRKVEMKPFYREIPPSRTGSGCSSWAWSSAPSFRLSSPAISTLSGSRLSGRPRSETIA